MKTLSVGEFKSNFSEVLKDVQEGDCIGICFGKKKEKRAVIISYEEYERTHSARALGVLKGKAYFSISDDFELSDEDLLGI